MNTVLIRVRDTAPRTPDGLFSVQATGLLGARVSHQYELIPWQVITLPANVSLAAAAAAYEADPLVERVEPNYELRLSLTPNDPGFNQLWGMQRIRAPAAWDVTTGSQDVVVAVIDTGIRYTHEDLADNMWVNPAPTFGDIHGARWTNGDGTRTSGDPMDDQGHGTHVAGTIGAVGNNARGVVGVTWRVRLMGLKFLRASGGGATADAISAVEYSITRGAHLSNNSWGGGGFSQALEDIINVARSSNRLFVAAAGNNSSNNDTNPAYPASYDLDNIISVASIAPGGGLSFFSNYGVSSVHLAAPGSDIYSAGHANDTAYTTMSGTSMACPHVAGAAALLLGLRSTAGYAEVRDAILDNVQPSPMLDGRVATGGELDLAAAVTGFGGKLELDRLAYRSDGTVTVSVTDPLVPAVEPAITVNWEVRTPALATRASGTLVLDRIPGTPVFAGSLVLQTGVTALHGDTLRVTYDTPLGMTLLQTAPIDDVPPVISNARIEEVSDDRLVVRWSTNEPADSHAAADPDLPPGLFSALSETFQHEHSLEFAGLEPYTRYFVAIASEDPAGNRTELPVNWASVDPEDYLAAVTRARNDVYTTDFERGVAGWTAQSLYGDACWELGVPDLGPYPQSTGWGTLLNERHPTSVNAVLVSPTIHVGDMPSIHFTHWFDSVGVHFVEVLRAGGWENVWMYAESEPLEGVISPFDGWRSVRIRLPDRFARQALRVRFRFEMGEVPEDYLPPAGWFIDTFRITEIPQDGLALRALDIDDTAPGGDGDGFAEPGETVELGLMLFNLSTTTIEDVHGSLVVLGEGQSTDAARLINGSPAMVEYGDIEAGDSLPALPSAPLLLQIAPELSGLSVLTVFQTLYDASGTVHETRRDIDLRQRGDIAGLVLDGNGDPVDGALVEVRHGSRYWDTTTLADGTFVVGGLPTGRPYAVSAAVPGQFAAVEKRVTAPAAGVEFRLGGAVLEATPWILNLEVQQGDVLNEVLAFSNAAGTLPLRYALDVAYVLGSDWLQLDPLSGVIDAGDTLDIDVVVDARGMQAGEYGALIQIDSNDALRTAEWVEVRLSVTERPLLERHAVRIETPNGRIRGGVATPLWVTLRNATLLSDCTGADGVLSSADGNAVVSTADAEWGYIAPNGIAESMTPFEVTLDAGLPDGAVATFDLLVTDNTGATFPLSFELVNSAFSLSGVVTRDILPDGQVGAPPPEYGLPVQNARIRVEDAHGVVMGTALTNNTGAYSIDGLGGQPLWVFVRPPANAPRMIPPPGQWIELAGDEVLDFLLRQDGTDGAPYHMAPAIVSAGVTVDDGVYQDGDGRIDPGERLVVRPRLTNVGNATAVDLTATLTAVPSPAGVPAVMTVVAGGPTWPINITPGSTLGLHPPFEVQVAPGAERGAVQRFVLRAVTATTPPREWYLNLSLQVDPAIDLAGGVAFADGPGTPEKVAAVRLRLTMGDDVRVQGLDAGGAFRFRDIPRRTAGLLEVIAVPTGYGLPAPTAIAPLNDSLTLPPIVLDAPDAVFPGLPTDGLSFTLLEGESDTQSFQVRNDGPTPLTLDLRRVYSRTLPDVETPPVEPMGIAGEEPGTPQVDAAGLDPAPHSDEEFIVRFDAGVSREQQREILAGLGMEPVFYLDSAPAALVRRIEGPATPGEIGALSAAAADLEGVSMIVPDGRMEPLSVLPNDQLFAGLYGLHNRRQTGGTWGADIGAAEAWTHGTGSASIVIAVCDSGVDITHEDLAANIWHNPHPRVFDPADPDPQIVDDRHGWNFGDWNNNVSDDNGHGTHVAGTIGAVGDNFVGVSGVNWSVSLMPVRLVNEFGSFTSSARIAKAIEYAVDNGAHVSNHSWGGPDPAGLMGAAIRYARDNNHLVIAAAGNSAQDVDVKRAFPAYYSVTYENVITVAATDHHGELARFSNFGAESVQIAAPGVDILSTMPPAIIGNPPYVAISGTSMAAPHVAGVAGLLWSLAPDAPWTVIREAILQGARPDPNLEGWVETAGHLDAARAIRALGPDWITTDQESITLAPGQTGTIAVTVNEPPALRARTAPYRGTILLRESNGAFELTVPVRAKVDASEWIDWAGVRIVNQEDHTDDFDASPGDQVALWVSLTNRSSWTVFNLQATLSGGGASVIHQNQAGWPFIDTRQTTESDSAFLVTLDPAAAGDLAFTVDLSVDGVPYASFPLTVPLLAGHAAQGQIVSLPSGLPVPGARIEAVGAGGARTTSAADGTFAMRGLSNGGYRLRVIPADHERLETAFNVAGADVALGALGVRAPEVSLGAETIALALPLGGADTRMLGLSNDSGTAEGPFTWSATLSPLFRVALVSDGLTLESLAAPLRAMGFEVAHYSNNFERRQRFWPLYNYHQIEQKVRYTHDAAFLADFDAVIVDTTGPNGAGRVLSTMELAAFDDYTRRGGIAILTGAHPLSQPDNLALGRLLGLGAPDRDPLTQSQSDVPQDWLSPWLTLHAGERFLTSRQRYELAGVEDVLATTALARVGAANKLLRRAQGARGAIYLWTGNPADADWDTAGVGQDLLRTILWQELVEARPDGVEWLSITQAGGVLAVGDQFDLALSVDVAPDLAEGRHEAVVVLAGNYPGEDVRAVRVVLDAGPQTVEAYTTGRVTDWRGRRLVGDGSERSAIFQVIWAGPDGTIDPPALDGSTTGDDRLMAAYTSGSPFGRFGVGHELDPDSGRFRQVFRHHVPAGSTGQVYVRAWDGPSFEMSMVYGDSALRELAFEPGEAHDFGSWTADRVLRYGRDSNGDSVPDGWLIENRPDLDPTAVHGPLASAATYAGRTNIPLGPNGTPALPYQVAVAENFVFVLDRANNRIARIDRATMSQIAYYGTSGQGAGQFAQPEGLALDPRPGVHRLAVADTANHRIQVFTFDPVTGVIAHAFTAGKIDAAGKPASGSGNREFKNPRGIAIRPGTGELFVADTENNRVQVLNAAGGFVRAFGGAGDFEMLKPQGIAADSHLGVFVADTGNHRILNFDVAGGVIDEFGSQGTGAGQFNQPTDIRIWYQQPPTGQPVRRLVVTDTLNHRVQLLAVDGTHLLNIGSYGQANGQLQQPFGSFPLRNTNRVYVADTHNDPRRIQWFDIVLDADGDGMDDLWEDRVGLDSTRDDSMEDPDDDGLLNIGEFYARTDPFNPDSNGNGVSDLADLYGSDVAALISLVADPAVVDAGEPVLVTATLDRALPAGADVLLTLSGASPRNARRMQTADGVVYFYTHLTRVGEAGWTDGTFYSGYVVAPSQTETDLFEVLDTTPPLPPLVPFPILDLTFDPPRIVWEAAVGGTYRIERSFDLTADPVVWLPVETITATADPMERPVPTDVPYAVFRIVRTQ